MAKRKNRNKNKGSIQNQLDSHLKELYKLKPSLLTEESKKWLEKAYNLRDSQDDPIKTYIYSSLAFMAAEQAVHFETEKKKKTNLFTLSFFEASLQKTKACVMSLITTDNTMKFFKESADPLKHALEISAIETRDQWIHQLHAVVEIAFDAEKFKYAFGIANIFPQETLGQGVFENRNRYAADIMDEFKKIIKHAPVFNHLLFISDEIINSLKKITGEATNIADQLNNRKYKIVINIVNQRLNEIIAKENASMPIYHALTHLGMFAHADNLDNRIGGAAEQKFEADIQDLVVEYLRPI